MLKGDEKNKEDFFLELQKLTKKKVKNKPRIELFEREKDFFIIITSYPKHMENKYFQKVFYNPALIHVSPSILGGDGWAELELASIKREDLVSIIDIGEKKYHLKLLRFGRRKIEHLGIISTVAELTLKQKKALELALHHGYYKYPRKTNIHELAKINKTSFSTFQAHLKKAENKIMSSRILF